MHLPFDKEGEDANDAIRDILEQDSPCMISRLGKTEAHAMTAYLNSIEKKLLYKLFALIRLEEFTWTKTIKKKMRFYSGFFPSEPDYLNKFSELMLENIKDIDVFGAWMAREIKFKDYYTEQIVVPLSTLDPCRFKNPWSKALKHKKVLVIHPFAETIKKQYKKREKLFDNQDVLPEFQLQTLMAVQSVAGTNVEFATWFDALDFMCREIDNIDFDIAIIGAGAYGLPLASYIKKIGKKAIHIGGGTQILFGIKGKKWDGREFYQKLYNKHWVRASEAETPGNIQTVENGTYW